MKNLIFQFVIKCIDVIQKLSSLALHPIETTKPSPPPIKKNPLGILENLLTIYPKHSPKCRNRTFGRKKSPNPTSLHLT
jgi:hypothetical protein